jgi:hypothetical protein
MEQMLDQKKWYTLPWVRTVAVAALITGAALTAWLVTDNPQTAASPAITEDRTEQQDASSNNDGQAHPGQTNISGQSSEEQVLTEKEQTPVPEEITAEDSANEVVNEGEEMAAAQQSAKSGSQQESTPEESGNLGLLVNRVNWQKKETPTEDPLINYPTRSSWAGMPSGYVTRSIRLMEPLERLTIDRLGPYHRPAGGGTDALQEYKQRRFRFWIGATGIPSLNVMTKAKLGYHAGVRVGVDFGQGTSLETGLGYTRFTYDEPVTAERQDYYLSTDLYFHQSTQGDLRYLEVPLRINYNLGDFARIQPYVAVGVSGFLTLTEDYVFNYKRNPNAISSNITPAADNTTDTVNLQNFGGNSSASTRQMDQTNAYQQFSYKPATTEETVELKPFYLMGQLAVGANYLITPETALNLGINYRFPVSGFGVENRSLHTVGVELGIKHLL